MDIILIDVSDEWRNNKEAMVEAVKIHGWTLNKASEGLKNDKEDILAAMKNYGWALEYASNELKDRNDEGHE